MRELGAIVRNQAPSGRASVLEAYGEVLLRGWRAAAGACLFEVEALIQVRTACPGLGWLGGTVCFLHVHARQSSMHFAWSPLMLGVKPPLTLEAKL